MSSPRWQFGVLATFVLASFAGLAVLVAMDVRSTDPFMPHAHCYLFNRQLIWLHGGSDLFIGSAYVAISATLVYLVTRARREIPFHWMMLAFATFIIACGATHFMELWTLQAARPRYWLSGNVKLVTAIASVAVAVLLPPLIPKVLALLEAARLSAERKVQLESAYTELGNVHEKVKQLDQLKTNFFANVSHELRTPLSLIFGPVDRLLESHSLGEAERRDLATVRRNALMLHKHVNDLLDISRLEAGKLTMHYAKVDLARLTRLMGGIFDSVVQERLIKVTIRAPESLVVEVDADKVQRVLINLLSNAFKFVPEGGEVRLSLSSTDDRAVLLVEDTGPGLPPDLRTSVFERFHQGDPATQQRFGGTGLGLSIVKEFVDLHGGEVVVGDAPGGGASFCVKLPLRAPQGAEVSALNVESGSAPDSIYRRPGPRAISEHDAETAWAQAQSERWKERLPTAAGVDGGNEKPLVLVVEDNREMNDFVARVLEPEFRTLSAHNGRQGLELAEAHLPDLILSDVMMPEMPGDELIRNLRERPHLASIPVILLTAKADDELKSHLLGEGAQDYVMKPFVVEELRARVRNLVANKLVRDTLQKELASQDDDIAELAQQVTQRARQLAEAKEAAEEANRAKDKFLAMLSHELRTPLTPALAAAMHLDTGGEIDRDQLRSLLGVIRRNIELEARLIDDLLDLTRISKGKIELHLATVDAHAALQDALAMCEEDIREKGSRLDVHLDAPRHHVRADGPRLLQVFWNLLLNAVKFTPAGGDITLRTSNNDGRLIVQVADTGIGIAPEVLGRIFEPFEQGEQSVTRQFGGLGLGLSVAKAFVDAHGGRISAASPGRNQGTTMTVELDTVSPPAEAPPEPAAFASHGAGGAALRVLLAEDHPDTREAMKRLLARWGCEVVCAGSMSEALAKAREAQFDVLISDLGLPDGHGTELMAEIKKISPIVGIAVSGFGMEEDIARSRAAGFTEHLTKPVGTQRLKEVIRSINRARRAGEMTS